MRSAALVVVLFLAACGASQSKAAETVPVEVVPEDTRLAAEGVLEQYRQAFEIASIEALTPLYSQDLDLLLVYQGKEHRGWTAVLAFLTQRLNGVSSVRMSFKDVSIRELGTGIAMIHATRESSMGDGSITVSERGILTLILQNRDGRWMVAAEHFSYPTGRL
ncbi:MAG: nuclear transport factor 2 family protein [Myxococcales bacterium]|nr:nuclear transport factor 2 family protein [Myxococcales bacterium]